MPKVEKPLTGTGLLVDFARDLRYLRRRARLTYSSLVSMTSHNYSALYQATAGMRLPRLEILESFVCACGGDVDAWRQRWHALDQAKRAGEVLRMAWPPELHNFLARLNALRKAAGTKAELREIADVYGHGHTYISNYIRLDAPRLPPLDLVLCVVKICGGDAAWWNEYWHRTARACNVASRSSKKARF